MYKTNGTHFKNNKKFQTIIKIIQSIHTYHNAFFYLCCLLQYKRDARFKNYYLQLARRYRYLILFMAIRANRDRNTIFQFDRKQFSIFVAHLAEPVVLVPHLNKL